MGYSNYKKSFFGFLATTLMTFVAVTACQSEKKSDAGVGIGPIPAPIQCIPGQPCQLNGAQPGFALATGVGSLDSNPAGSQLMLTFSSPTALPINQNGTMPSYSGPVLAVGEIFIAAPVNGCPGVIPGRFPITVTTQQGTWNNGSFYNLAVQASNGMIIKMPNNFLMTQYGSVNPVRIKNPVYISTTGGPDCAFVSL